MGWGVENRNWKREKKKEKRKKKEERRKKKEERRKNLTQRAQRTLSSLRSDKQEPIRKTGVWGTRGLCRAATRGGE
jgi:hypothetical protein